MCGSCKRRIVKPSSIQCAACTDYANILTVVTNDDSCQSKAEISNSIDVETLEEISDDDSDMPNKPKSKELLPDFIDMFGEHANALLQPDSNNKNC